MILVLGVVVIVVIAAGSGLLSWTGGGTHRDGTNGRLGLLVLVAGALFVVLLLVVGAGFVMRGSGGGEGDGGDGSASEPTPTTAGGRPEAVSSKAPGRTPVAEAPPPLPVIAVNGSDPDDPGPYVTVDRLGPDPLVRVTAAGFEPFETGFVEQCVAEVGLLPACTGRFPVQFGEDGGGEFQFGMRTASAPGGCQYARPTCILRLSGVSSGRLGEVQTVVGPARRGRVDVSPDSGLGESATAQVVVTGFPPRTSATAMLCAPLGGYDVRRCGGAGGPARFDVGPDGSGRTSLAVGTGPVGVNRLPCGPRHPCGVLVVVGDGFVAAPAVPLQFSLGPGATYNTARLVTGLVLGASLMALAFLLARRTDWNKPTEAATPEVDAADLQTGGTLDDLFGTDAEIEARDPIPS